MCVHGCDAIARDNRVIKLYSLLFLCAIKWNDRKLVFSCDLDSVMQQVEWVTLIFFGSMFITMECLSRLGLIKWIGKQTEYLILMGDERFRLTLAIIIILWVTILLWVFV